METELWVTLRVTHPMFVSRCPGSGSSVPHLACFTSALLSAHTLSDNDSCHRLLSSRYRKQRLEALSSKSHSNLGRIASDDQLRAEEKGSED